MSLSGEKKTHMTFAEMFSGIGGFRLGLERSGWSCVWANDVDKYANQIYKKKFGNGELVEGDIREVSAKTVPDHTLLTAGFPCQAFSVAGKRKALTENRGTLFTHIVRVARAKRPPLLLLENVKGILSSDNGRTFAIILRALANLGYLLEWQVLNSKHFGVPQNRERVFIVGHLRGEHTKQIFPIRKTDENSVTRSTTSPSQNSKSLRVGSHLNARGTYIATSALIQSQGREPHIETRKDEVSHALKGKGGWEGNYILGVTLANTSRYNQGVNRTPIKRDKLSFALNSAGDQGVLVVADRTRTYANKGRNLESPKQETNALSSVQKDNLLLKNCRIRRLTPTECERLQGFPDGWTKGISDTQRYKVLGNAVTVNVIEFLGEKLKEALR